MSLPSLLLCSGQIFENVTQHFSLLRAHLNVPEPHEGVGALKRTGGVQWVGREVKWPRRAMEKSLLELPVGPRIALRRVRTFHSQK